MVYLQNTDTAAEVQTLAFDFVNGKVRMYNAKDELLDILHFERGDVAFISTDPHWFNYPYQTPYSYVGNNPIMKIDPTGMDEWEINDKGEVQNRIATTKHDAFFMVDKDGNRIDGKSISFKFGTVKHKHNTYQGGNYDVFKVKGDDNGTTLFEFMAKNTKVEIGLTRTGIDGIGTNYITTSHEQGSESGFMYLYNGQLRYKYFIRERTHSHPNGIPVPSGMPGTTQEGSGDIFTAHTLTNNNQVYKYKEPVFKIYKSGFGYKEYSSKSQVSDFEDVYEQFNKRPVMK